MSDTFNLIFFPTVQDGQNEIEVRANLVTALKVDEEKVNSWFAMGTPTVLLKDVDEATASRYRDAIRQCGANCNIQPSSGGKTNLSLVPKSARTDLFFCPSCEYEEDLPHGQTYDVCPKCGLVMEKWQEKMREEKEKEEIRRRLMRQARLKEDDAAEKKRKQDELARLKRLEAEIMKELGLKAPSAAWLFFERHPVMISLAFGVSIIAATALGMHQFELYITEQEMAAIEAAPATPEMQEIAPAMAAAVQLQQNGNEATLTEIADVTSAMQGARAQQQQMVAAAESLLKGVGADAFLQNAKMGGGGKPSGFTRVGENESAPVAVNVDTLGGISDLPGISSMDAEMASELKNNTLVGGSDDLLDIMGSTVLVRNPDDPAGPSIEVDKLTEMDGSMIVSMVQNLNDDPEWDMYTLSNVTLFIDEGKLDDGVEMISAIRSPEIRVRALIHMMERALLNNPDTPVRGIQDRVIAELEEIKDRSVRVRLLLDGAKLLADAGAIDQPYANMEIAESLLKDQAGGELAQSAADLAVAYVRVGDNTKARTMFNRALGAAGALNATPDRIIAFTRIAMRYYDARNTTLANEILAEAQVLAATRLVSRDRSRVFAQIAIAQAYLGDIPGALQSAGNAATGEAYQQVLVGVVTALIEAGRTFEAQAIIEKIEADKAYHQLVLRLATYLFYEGDTQRATGLLTSNIPRISLISKLEEQTIFLSQYARVLARLSDRARSVSLFDEAFDLTLKMTDRSQSVNQGMIALDQAKALYVTRAKNTANEIAEPFVRDPVLSQIADIERTLMTVFPESILSKAE